MLKSILNFIKISLLFLSCFIQAQSFTGPSTLQSGTAATYTASQASTNYYWSATGGLTINGSNTSDTVSVSMGTTCGYLYLVAYGQNASSNYCFKGKICPQSPPPPPPSCSLNSGVINDLLCVTNSHPNWRLQIEGYTEQDVTYSWTSQHFTIISGQNSSYIIGNPTDNGFGFTLYCTITKTCSGGTKISRTFYYQSNSTKSCNQGTTGEFFGSGGEIDLNARGAEIKPELNGINELRSFPNPFNSETTIKYYVAKDNADVNVSIYNDLGQLVSNPIQEKVTNSGYYEIKLDGKDFRKKGLYFIKLSINGELLKTHKIYFN